MESPIFEEEESLILHTKILTNALEEFFIICAFAEKKQLLAIIVACTALCRVIFPAQILSQTYQ